MKRKILFSLTAIIILLVSGLLVFLFMMRYEPEPSKREVERMAGTKNLQKIGDVEGSFLYTPRNYGFYNEKNIIVVEKSFGEEEEYNNQYVAIKPGEEIGGGHLTLEEKLRNLFPFTDRIRVHSRHQVFVFKGGEMVREERFYKVTFAYQGQNYLSFVSAQQEEERFNFSIKGFEELQDF